MDTSRGMVWLVVLVFNPMVLAYGGGSGGSIAPDMATGVFKDSNVSGVVNETSSGQSGFTNQNGEYAYVVGDTVTFFVGGVVMGRTSARGIVTPVDLVAGGSTSSPQVESIITDFMSTPQYADFVHPPALKPVGDVCS